MSLWSRPNANFSKILLFCTTDPIASSSPVLSTLPLRAGGWDRTGLTVVGNYNLQKIGRR
jgi:hypothetical protein